VTRAAVASARWPLLVALLAVLVHVNALGNGFTLDDRRLVEDNPAIRSLAGLPRLLVEPYWPQGEASGLHRPVTIASLALNRAVTGAGPFGFHLVNVLLHGLVTALLWLAARRAGLHYGTALACAALFAVHPLHTEAVANIAGRAELLAAAGVLGAWLLHRRAADDSTRGGRGPAIAAAGLYLLAFLSKETAVLAPVLFWVDDRLRRRSGETPRPAGAYLGYAGAVAVAIVLRFVALGGLRGAEDVAFIDNPAAAGGGLVRIATALWVLVRYAGLFVWPASLSSDYSFDAIPAVDGLADPRWMVGALLAAGVVALGAWGFRRSRPVCLAAAIAVLFLLPASNLPFTVGTLMAERLVYLPTAGVCLLLGHMAAALARNDRGVRATVVAVVVGALVAAAGWRTWQRNPDWSDNLTLTLRDVETQPRSAKLHAGAGIALHVAGREEEAERRYRRALEIYPDYAQVHYNLGELLAESGRTDAAIASLRRASEIAPANPRPYRTLARLLRQRGRTDEALEAYARGVAADPGDFRFRFDYGRALLGAQGWGRAIDVFAALAEDDPAGVWGRIARVLVLDWQGETAEALALLDEVLARPQLEDRERDELRRLRSAIANRPPRDGATPGGSDLGQ
jgi:tetratricopeptide (TPR) repeat protein